MAPNPNWFRPDDRPTDPDPNWLFVALLLILCFGASVAVGALSAWGAFGGF